MTESTENTDDDMLKCPVLSSKLSDLDASIENARKILETPCAPETYARLCPADKAKYDLFLAYSLNSLFWVYMRTQGRDPTCHSVKGELDRVKEYMMRAKQLQDRQNMPRVDQAAARRFIRSGLWEPGQKERNEETPGEQNERNGKETPCRQNARNRKDTQHGQNERKERERMRGQNVARGKKRNRTNT